MKRVVIAVVVLIALAPASLFASGISVISTDTTDLPSVTLSLDNGGGCVVAGEVEIEYNADLFALASIDREVSVFTLWLPDATSTGRIILSGGVPGGFCGAFSGEGIVTSLASLSFIPLTAEVSLTEHIRIGTTTALYDGSGEQIAISAL
jgi:hypothetical protein